MSVVGAQTQGKFVQNFRLKKWHFFSVNSVLSEQNWANVMVYLECCRCQLSKSQISCKNSKKWGNGSDFSIKIPTEDHLETLESHLETPPVPFDFLWCKTNFFVVPLKWLDQLVIKLSLDYQIIIFTTENAAWHHLAPFWSLQMVPKWTPFDQMSFWTYNPIFLWFLSNDLINWL